MLIMTAIKTQAQSKNNDFGVTDSKKSILTSEEIRNQFQLNGKVFITDGNGKLLYQGKELRIWEFGSKGDLVSNWSFKSPGIQAIAMTHTWTIKNDGKIFAHIKQYDSMERGKDRSEVITGKLLREEVIEVKDFQPINWIAFADSNQRVIVRLTPNLIEKSDYIKADAFPISLKNPVAFDSKGQFWAQAPSLEGRYVSMKTHLGQFAISYVPFKNAKEIGFVDGSQMTINVNKNLKLFVRSEAPIITTNRPVRIYGVVDQKKKSERVNSVYSSASSEEKEFTKEL